MSNRNQRRNRAAYTKDEYSNQLRERIASNLGVETELIRYAMLEENSKIGVTGRQWQIKWRGKWRELPWHFDGPTHVTWQMIRQWHG